MQAKGKEAQLKPYEIPTVVVIEWRPWMEVAADQSEGQLTLTGKVKRGFVKKQYEFLCNQLYTLHEQSAGDAPAQAEAAIEQTDRQLLACGEELLKTYNTQLADAVLYHQPLEGLLILCAGVLEAANDTFQA